MNRRQCIALAPAIAVGVAMPRWSAELARALSMRPDAWYGRVTGAPPGKERCSSTAYIGWVYGGKQWLQEESVPDFLLLTREPRAHGWTMSRGYLGNSRIRYDTGGQTLRQVRASAESLTGGLLAPWVPVPRQMEREQLIAFAQAQVLAATQT